MSMDPRTFETLTPFQFIEFTIPNPVNQSCYLRTSLLRVAVLDSPVTATTSDVPLVAAMIVPDNRETDWIFCTESGHLQLLFNFPQVSRLVLIGNDRSISSEPLDYVCSSSKISVTDKEKLEEELSPLVLALHPILCFRNGLPEALFLNYEDDVLCSVVLERCVGPFVGEFLVEDVEVEGNCHASIKGGSTREFRRRLRFKRMPNLIQTQVRILASDGDGKRDDGLDLVSPREMGKVDLQFDTAVLVHPYLTPMVAGLSLTASCLNERIQQGHTPRALCLGVGGGALISFLNTRLGFEVVGVEADEVVLRVAKQYFGLNDGKSVRLIVGDGIELMEDVASLGKEGKADPLQVFSVDGLDTKFDVVMVDLDSSEARTGISAPPLEFVRKPVFLASRSVLHEYGVLVINVIPPDELFYATLVHKLKDVFQELYEIDVGNGENCVLMATLSPIIAPAGNGDNLFLKKLKSVISGVYVDSMVRL